MRSKILDLGAYIWEPTVSGQPILDFGRCSLGWEPTSGGLHLRAYGLGLHIADVGRHALDWEPTSGGLPLRTDSFWATNFQFQILGGTYSGPGSH